MILDTIAASTRKRVEKHREKKSLEQVRREALELAEKDGRAAEERAAGPEDEQEKAVRSGKNQTANASLVLPFEAALRRPGVSFICEAKKASPSKGLIAPHFPYVDIAREYEEAGADAMSVLTEPEFFLGNDSYLEEIHRAVDLPLLRKDFTIDEYQIYEAKVLGASAVLLICSLLNGEQLKRYIGICRELGLSQLVEAHTDEEVSVAAEAGATIIGINNRNLKTFEVDFSNALRLRRLVDKNTVFVAESGIRGPEDVKALAEAKVDAVLIGETLMRAENKKEMLQRLRAAAGGLA
ncbi:indole-3-glycerol phosphate synthase TrpC [Lacrimispora sp. 210928-DFI.3.58]|uniref:indole-3-glycerol phosphate synthase TrpC n=1 Tax=Lacrimispora sp. 210928-DFI.3.58 TaxID=2883214 RepID=UPI0015B48601|nr:indole-3-glycerol phosphate synthase TrpC [Lacrimispora sp. 210928-DFI.3.58]MCB7320903.1 indole-3-glycerol phosphate synthase TrpC [Lacrimispora sp. 210928-DFI.3.58]